MINNGFFIPMRIKKALAIEFINFIKQGFASFDEIMSARQCVIACYENGSITKKDCGILTNILDDLVFDNYVEDESY